jgi:electron transport complex protein RnfD
VLGSLVAVLPGKMIFGGLGHNVFNPALVGRAFLQAAFPVSISTYYPALNPHRFESLMSTTLAIPLMKAPPDALSGATPLAQAKFDHVIADLWVMFRGERAGSIGETCIPLIFLCGLYLILRKFMDWRIPAAMLLGAVAMGEVFHLMDPKAYPGPMFVLFAGGLMLGAMFMATDPVASPVTPRGMWIYGILMGILTVLIRFLGGLAEGVMYAVLLGNALSPLIDSLNQPRTYGERKKSMLAKGAA